MKALVRILALWSVLALALGLFVGATGNDPMQLLAVCGLFLLPPLAVWLTVRAVMALPANWFFRAAFWAVTGAGWFAAASVAQGRFESNPGYLAIFNLAVGGVAVSAVWLVARARCFPTLRGLGEAVAGGTTLVLAGSVWVWTFDARTRAIAAQAEARWAEIGRPMAEFEKTLTPGQENAGSDVFRQVLRTELGSRFYKEGTAAAEREPAIEQSKANEELMARAVSIVCAKVPPSDDFDLSPQPVGNRIKRASTTRRESHDLDPPADPVTADEPMAPVLEADFRRILAAEPPAWASDPHDGYTISVPNYLGIRKFAQLTQAESLRRFAAGDAEGAARAIDAGLRIGQSLRNDPTLVSLMVHVAVDATLAPQRVRLPATEDGLPSIARDAAAWRVELIKRAQLESWAKLRYAGGIDEDQQTIAFHFGYLPKWAYRIANRHLARGQFAIGALSDAEHTAILQAPTTLHLPDLGASLHEAVAVQYPSVMEVNWIRAAMRIEATLLLREQTEFIRAARASLAAGQAVESRDSVVLPGVRWELIADAEKNTVATHLVGVPDWITKNEVTTNAFWLLPLDGSVAWQFRPRAQTASR